MLFLMAYVGVNMIGTPKDYFKYNQTKLNVQ